MRKATTLFTIGFTHKGAREFFETLKKRGVRRVIDIRLSNSSQLAGYTKKDDLAYFLESILGIEYLHVLELAPTEALFKDHRSGDSSWEDFAARFSALMEERRPEQNLPLELLDGACLLCSERDASDCHRSLVAAHFRRVYPELEVVHL